MQQHFRDSRCSCEVAVDLKGGCALINSHTHLHDRNAPSPRPAPISAYWLTDGAHGCRHRTGSIAPPASPGSSPCFPPRDAPKRFGQLQTDPGFLPQIAAVQDKPRPGGTCADEIRPHPRSHGTIPAAGRTGRPAEAANVPVCCSIPPEFLIHAENAGGFHAIGEQLPYEGNIHGRPFADGRHPFRRAEFMLWRCRRRGHEMASVVFY